MEDRLLHPPPQYAVYSRAPLFVAIAYASVCVHVVPLHPVPPPLARVAAESIQKSERRLVATFAGRRRRRRGLHAVIAAIGVFGAPGRRAPAPLCCDAHGAPATSLETNLARGRRRRVQGIDSSQLE